MSRPFCPEDLYRIRQVVDVALHPDGDRVAYVVAGCDEDDDANHAAIWMRSIDDAEAVPRRLTWGPVASSPTFSPDGQRLAYVIADIGAPPQLAVMSLDGGEPRTITDFEDGVGDPSWLPDSSGLIVTAATRPEDQQGVEASELAHRARRIDTVRYRYNGRGWIHDRRSHVFRVDLPDDDGGILEPLQLTDGPWDDVFARPSADGRFVLFRSERHDDRETVAGGDIHRVPVDGGEAERLTDNKGSFLGARPHPDGDEIIVFGQVERAEIALAYAHRLDVDGGEARRVGVDDVAAATFASPSGPIAEFFESWVYTHGVRQGAFTVDRHDLITGATETVVGGKRAVGAFAVRGADGAVVFAASTPTSPAELFVADQAGERQLTSLNAELAAEVSFAELVDVEVASADGHPVHGFLFEPPSVVAATGAALVYVHGGPLAQYGYGFFDEFQMAAATGHVVIGANPRGSDGYGSPHATAIVGDMGNLDWADITAITDHLAGRDDVDADRIGIGGGSYGGFMTTWAVGHTDRYRAALSERAVNNWESMQGTSDIGTFFAGLYLGADNRSDIERVRAQSPITHAEAITTPLLILHGEEDWRCPIEQAEQLFVLVRGNGVESEFVRFPGANHELTRSGRPSLRVERFHIVHEWWARHLGSLTTHRPD